MLVGGGKILVDGILGPFCFFSFQGIGILLME
jgi:hypothetical protein